MNDTSLHGHPSPPGNPPDSPPGGHAGNRPARPPRRFYEYAVCALLALLVLLAAAVPRLCAYAPPAAGLLLALAAPLWLRRRPGFPRAAGIWTAVLLLLAGLSAAWALAPGEAGERTLKAALVLLPGLLLAGAAGLLPRPPAAAYATPAGRAETRTRLSERLGTAWRTILPPRAAATPTHLPAGCALVPLAWLAAALLLATEMWSGLPLYHIVHDIPFEKRVRLDFLNRQVVAVLLTAPPVFALILNGAVPRFARPAEMAALAALALLLVLLRTSSQSAQLAALVMLAFCAAFPYRCKIAWIALSALLAGGVMTAPWLVQFLFRRLPGLLAHIPIIGNPQAYAANRLEVWDYVGRYALKEPLHGFGIEATRTITDFDSAQLYQAGTSILHPHNVALQLWMEFGVVGALAGTGFLLHLLWRARRLPPRAARMALPLLMGTLSVGAMTYGLWQGWWLGLLVLSGALAALAVQTTPAPAPGLPLPGSRDDPAVHHTQT